MSRKASAVDYTKKLPLDDNCDNLIHRCDLHSWPTLKLKNPTPTPNSTCSVLMPVCPIGKRVYGPKKSQVRMIAVPRRDAAHTLTPLTARVEIAGKTVKATVDTGCSHSTMTLAVVERLGLSGLVRPCKQEAKTCKTADGARHELVGIIDNLALTLGNSVFGTKFYVAFGNHFLILLGNSFICPAKLIIDMENLCLHRRINSATVETIPLTVHDDSRRQRDDEPKIYGSAQAP